MEGSNRRISKIARQMSVPNFDADRFDMFSIRFVTTQLLAACLLLECACAQTPQDSDGEKQNPAQQTSPQSPVLFALKGNDELGSIQAFDHFDGWVRIIGGKLLIDGVRPDWIPLASQEKISTEILQATKKLESKQNPVGDAIEREKQKLSKRLGVKARDLEVAPAFVNVEGNVEVQVHVFEDYDENSRLANRRTEHERKYLGDRYELASELTKRDVINWQQFMSEARSERAGIIYSALTKYLEADKAEFVTYKAAENLGVNLIALPLMQEKFAITPKQKKEIAEIFAARRKEREAMLPDWYKLVLARVPLDKLRQFQDKVEEFDRDTETQLLKVLDEQQRKKIELFWKYTAREFSSKPEGFKIPGSYEHTLGWSDEQFAQYMAFNQMLANEHDFPNKEYGLTPEPKVETKTSVDTSKRLKGWDRFWETSDLRVKQSFETIYSLVTIRGNELFLERLPFDDVSARVQKLIATEIRQKSQEIEQQNPIHEILQRERTYFSIHLELDENRIELRYSNNLSGSMVQFQDSGQPLIAIDVLAAGGDRKYIATRHELGNEVRTREHEQWMKFEAEHVEDYARIRMAALKSHLKTKQLDDVMSKLAAEAGVNFFAIPYYRELLDLSDVQANRIDEIYRSGRIERQRLDKEWSALRQAGESEKELKSFQKKVTEFELKTEDELFSVLGDQRKRVERFFTDDAKVDLSAPKGFEIPAGYKSKH